MHVGAYQHRQHGGNFLVVEYDVSKIGGITVDSTSSPSRVVWVQMLGLEFSRQYKPSTTPVGKLVELLKAFMAKTPTDPEAIAQLGKLTDLKEIIAMTAVEAEVVKTKATAAAPKAAKEPKEPKAAKEPKEPKAAKEPKEPKAAKEPRESASSMFKRLILEGKLSDDEIFKQVQERFSLDDTKRSYVAWNRSFLTRQGLLPSSK